MGFSIRRNQQLWGVSLTDLRNLYSSHALERSAGTSSQDCCQVRALLGISSTLSDSSRADPNTCFGWQSHGHLCLRLFFLLLLSKHTTDCQHPGPLPVFAQVLYHQPLSTFISEENLTSLPWQWCRKQSSPQNRILTLMSHTRKTIFWRLPLAWASWLSDTGGWLLIDFTPFSFPSTTN